VNSNIRITIEHLRHPTPMEAALRSSGAIGPSRPARPGRGFPPSQALDGKKPPVVTLPYHPRGGKPPIRTLPYRPKPGQKPPIQKL
jgi:hypothetical protein